MSRDPRRGAYDAVFDEIRERRAAPAANAFVWRCVHAALNAVNIGIPVDSETGQPMLLPEPDSHDPDRWSCNAGTITLEPAISTEGESTVWFREEPFSPDDAYELAHSLLAAWRRDRDVHSGLDAHG